jgi:PadR family transcriptional regulator
MDESVRHHPPGSHHQHGWRPLGPRHRWLEPFVLVLIASGICHGYALASRLAELEVAPGALDVGELYRTLRELEEVGLVRSEWVSPPGGTRRRDYVLAGPGQARLREWGAVMHERARLVDEFLAAYEQTRTDAAGAAGSNEEA